MVKLYIENNKVIAILEGELGIDYEVPSDFKKKFLHGTSYMIKNGEVVEDVKMNKIKELNNIIFEKESFLYSTSKHFQKAQEYLILDKDIPTELKEIIKKRQRVEVEIEKLTEELEELL